MDPCITGLWGHSRYIITRQVLHDIEASHMDTRQTGGSLRRYGGSYGDSNLVSHNNGIHIIISRSSKQMTR